MSYKVSPVISQVCALTNAKGALKEGVSGSMSDITIIREDPMSLTTPVNRHERRKQNKLRRQVL
jgi:hypothetical protein